MREYLVEYETKDGRYACEWFAVTSSAVLAAELSHIAGKIVRISVIN